MEEVVGSKEVGYQKEIFHEKGHRLGLSGWEHILNEAEYSV